MVVASLLGFPIRGQKVMLDSELADLYQVTTGNLNLAVRRNVERFPEDFMFQLTKEEHTALLLQIARAKTGRSGRQTPRASKSWKALRKSTGLSLPSWLKKSMK